MSRVKRGVTIGAAVAAPALVAVVAMSGASSAQQARPVSDVNVVNTTGSPVPVAAQGTTQVAGTVNVGNLPATQPISGTVAVSNLPATQPITGAVVISHDDPAPFHAEADGRLDRQFPSASFQVPAGQRLLVDYLSVSVSAYAGTINPNASISGTSGGRSVRYFEQLTSAPASYGTHYGAQHQVRMSFDPGTTVSLSVHRTSGSDGLLFFNVHGELIPV